MKVVWFGSFAV